MAVRSQFPKRHSDVISKIMHEKVTLRLFWFPFMPKNLLSMSVTRARTWELKFLMPNYAVASILECRVPGFMSRKNVFLTLRFPVIRRRGANNSTKISSRTSRNGFLVQGHFGVGISPSNYAHAKSMWNKIWNKLLVVFTRVAIILGRFYSSLRFDPLWRCIECRGAVSALFRICSASVHVLT